MNRLPEGNNKAAELCQMWNENRKPRTKIDWRERGRQFTERLAELEKVEPQFEDPDTVCVTAENPSGYAVSCLDNINLRANQEKYVFQYNPGNPSVVGGEARVEDTGRSEFI